MDRPGAFLDRDGVLNRSAVIGGKPHAPRRLEDFRLLPGVAQAVARLKAAGLIVVVVTNQPDIGNGLVDESVVAAMHARLKARVPVDDIRVCPHRQDLGCSCRKPRPGMLLEAARDHGIDLTRSVMVGDRAGDIAAGTAAGCRTVFIDRGYPETRRSPTPVAATFRARSLPAALPFLLGSVG